MNIKILGRIVLIALLAVFSLTACSKSEGEKPQVAIAEPVMPTDYSHQAVDTYSELSGYFPEQTSFAVFASYGTIVDTVQAVKTWELISPENMDSMISDLEMHYRLNPSKLKSFYKAGFHTGKGFGVGIIDGSLVFVVSVMDQDKVLDWLMNFTNEEYGRPVTESRNEKEWKVTEIRVMDADYATVAQKGDVAVIALGSKFGTVKSADAAASVMAVENAPNNFKTLTQQRGLDKQLGNSEIGALVLNEEGLPGTLSKNEKKLFKQYVSNLNAGISLHENNVLVRVGAGLNAENKNIKMVDDLGLGSISPWAKAIVNSSQGPMARVLFNPVKLEKMVLTVLPESFGKKWEDIKGKLTQKFLGINFYEQVFSNLSGSLWVSLDSTSLQPGTPMTLSNALKLDAAVYLPIEDAELAGKFFGKVSFLKSFIPADKATLETLDGGILHASVKVLGAALHVSYADGLLALSTDSSWQRVMKLYQAADQKQPEQTGDGILLGSKKIALQLTGSDLVSLLDSVCADRCGKTTQNLSKFDKITIFVDEAKHCLEVEVSADKAVQPQT